MINYDCICSQTACDPSANTTPRQILQGVLAPFPLPWTPASLTVDDGADKSSRTSQFQQWLKNERFPGHERVTVSERAGEGLSVAFNVSVMRGQQCLRVPRRFFFGAHRDESSSLAINRPLFQAIQEHPALQQNASMRLVVALWLECTARGKQSFWWPYLQMLPRDFTIPLFYRADDWDALRGSLCYGRTCQHTLIC